MASGPIALFVANFDRSDKTSFFRTSYSLGGDSTGTKGSKCSVMLTKNHLFWMLQYSSQTVETDTASLEFSRKFLRFTPRTFVLTVMCPLPPLCWATRILKHWDRCNVQINIGEGKKDTSVSRFLTRIVFSLKRGKGNCFTSRRNFGPNIPAFFAYR